MKRMSIWLVSLSLLLAGALGLQAPAAAAVITFDGVDTVLDNTGATGETIDGVTFTYDGLGSGIALIGDYGPVIGEPLLIGESLGILTMDFAVPVTALGFAFYLDARDDVTMGVTGELWADQVFGDLVDVVTVAAIVNPATTFPEGQFRYQGTPISRAQFFFDTDDSFAFYLDNVEHQPVPESSTLLLIGTGLLGLVGRARKRR